MTAPLPKTEVKVNARLELLRRLAQIRLAMERSGKSDYWPEMVPLSVLEEDLVNATDDVKLAIRECAAIGHVTSKSGINGFDLDTYLKITDAGLHWIQAHDLAGELEQEGLA